MENLETDIDCAIRKKVNSKKHKCSDPMNSGCPT